MMFALWSSLNHIPIKSRGRIKSASPLRPPNRSVKPPFIIVASASQAKKTKHQTQINTLKRMKIGSFN